MGTLARHNRDVKEYIKECNICQSVKISQEKYPLIPHDVLNGPCEKVGIDIFQYGSHEYLLVAGYFSNFPLIRVLNNPMATHVINILKTVFSEHDIPACVFTDQGRLLTSTEFKEFAKCYRFEALHSTLRYPQSNGFIESMVKVVKQIMSKADQAREDAHLAMLAYRVTPREPGKLSTAEVMTQCKFKALLPVMQYLSAQIDESREIIYMTQWSNFLTKQN